MNLTDIPLFSILKSRLGYLSERQQLISQNVANADTPGFAPSDLKPFIVPSSTAGVAGALAMTPTQTNPAHLSGATTAAAAKWRPEIGADSETKMDGNKVVLEEQMMKMTDARMNYDAAINFYEKSVSMLQLAIRMPGKGA
jgi:flagellar basal-body rod protein FlgB